MAFLNYAEAKDWMFSLTFIYDFIHLSIYIDLDRATERDVYMYMHMCIYMYI